MRAIKFRGKSICGKRLGEWIHGYYLPDFDGYTHRTLIVDSISGLSEDVNPTTVGQFTGLFDKNQSEVYGGDIIKAPSGRIYLVMWATWIHQERRKKWIVDEYQFTGWCIGYERNKPIDTLDSEVLQGEVIGNVHDNPELINE